MQQMTPQGYPLEALDEDGGTYAVIGWTTAMTPVGEVGFGPLVPVLVSLDAPAAWAAPAEARDRLAYRVPNRAD